MSHLDLDALAAVFQNCTGDSVEFSQGALPGQKSLFGASAAPRAPSPGRPKTPVAPRPSLLESIADEESKQPQPLPGQGEFAFHEQAEEFSPVHHAVAKRFNIPPAAVKSVLETHPDELARRDRYVAPSSQMHDTVGPTLDYEDHPLGTARIGWPRHSTGNTNEAYVDFLREFDPSKLNSSEHEQSADYERDRMKKSGSVTAYVNWLKEGHKPPPISVYDVDGKPGAMQSSNRRRLLAAQMSGAKSITGWHGTSNPETGNPLNYGDILKAAREHEGQSFSRDDDFGPVEFGRSHTLPTQPFRRLIDKKRTHHDVLKEEEKAGKKKKAPTDNGESGWTKVGGSSVHVDDDGVIDKGCPGLLGEEVEDLIDESDESRERREARQHHAYAAGVTGDKLTPAQAKALGSDEHVAAYRRDMAAAKAHPVPTVSAIDVARGFDDQTGLPITSRPVTAAHSVPRDGGNGHELRIEDDARTAETEERLAQQPAETFQPAPELDPRAKPYQFWKQNPLSQILGNDLPRPSWLGDRPQPDHAAGEKLGPQLEQMEAEIARIRELRDAFLSKRVDIAALKANGYSSAEIAQAGVKEALNNKLEPLVEARNTVKAQLDDYLQQTRPDYQRQQDIARHKEVERRLWERGAEEDSAVRRAAKVYGADIDEVIASIPRAMVAYAEANFPLEAAKAEARRLTGLNAHTIRSVEDEIPDGDIKADSLLRTHPELGWQYGDTDNQRKMVELIREGSAQMPSRTSSEIADLAASMVVGGRPRDFSTEGIHFRDDSEDESLSDSDEWSPAGDTAETSFDPSSWSRQPMAAHPPHPLDAHYPRAGSAVDGRDVGDTVHNTDSISSSLDDYEEVPGIREVSMSHFPHETGKSYSVSENDRIGKLARTIHRNNRIDPLIVVHHPDGPYVLEGGHRLPALHRLGAKSFPALVVTDNEAWAPHRERQAYHEAHSLEPKLPAHPASLPGQKHLFSRPANGNVEPSHVLSIIQGSPNQPKDRDWKEFSARWGVNEPFHQVQLPMADVLEHNHGGRLRLSNHVDQSAIQGKVKSGKINPTVISSASIDGKPTVLDGTHSLHAAHALGLTHVLAYVSASAAKRLGIPVEQEFSRSDSVESIAAALGVSVSAIQAVIQDMPGSRADGLASLARLARDPSRRGVVRSREGHVIGYVTRNGNQLTFRDGNSRFLGTATHGHDRATFRDRRGHVGGSVGQFSRSLDEIGPVEFSVSGHGALVEPDGSPSVVYHGTNASFSDFDASRAGARSGNLGHLGFGHYFYAKGGNPKQWGNRVIAAKVRLQNPLNIHETSSLHPEWKKREAAENSHVDNAIGDPEFSAALKQKGNLRLAILHYGPQKFTDALTKHGHDGVISHSVSPEGVARRNEIVAFHPKQIDTVSENSTNFSRDFGPVEFSADPPSQVHHTQTPAFKKWHEGSHVVHEDGKPKVVYHGTRSPIEAFDKSKTSPGWHSVGGSFFFSETPSLANEYAGTTNAEEGGNVIPAYLSLKNPYRAESLGPLIRQFGAHGHADARAHLEKQGHDGMILGSGENKTIAAFHPHQIKSAIGNSGAFDPQDNRITFSRDFGPVEFGRSPLPGQRELPFDAVKSNRPQIETAHDGTRQVDIPETRTNAPFRATLKTGKTDGLTHFVTLDHAGKDWSKFRAPTQHVERFLDELHGHLGHPANSGHKTLDHVLSGGGKYIGKGNDNAVYDAGNGTVVKAAVITPYHEGNGLRSPDAANAIIDDSVKATKHLRSKGVLGILPQYGVNHDGRSFAVMPKVDTTSPLTEKHIQQLQDTLSGMHSAGYRLGDQVQAGLDHNGNAAIYDVGSVSALDPERDGAYGHNREDDDFSELSRLAEKHGIKYTRPKLLDKASKYRQMLHDVLDSKGMTPEEAWQSQQKLHSSARGLSIKPKGFGGATETQDPEGHDEWGMHDAAREQLEKWSGKPTYQVSQRPPSTVQMSRDEFHEGNRAVDASGKPIVFYHGTTQKFKQFAAGRDGAVHFSANREMAEPYALRRGDLHAVHVSVKNPYSPKPEDNVFNATEAVAHAKHYGHDGVVFPDEHGNPGQVSVFHPHQIRHVSVTNCGTGEVSEFSRKPASGQSSFDWDEEAHPRAKDGKWVDQLHHQIKNYLMNGGQFGLPDIHNHTGHTDHDALDPLANPTTLALKSLVDADAISRTGPEHHNVRFYLTDEQREQHEASGFASEKRDAKSDAKPEEKAQAGPAGLTKREAIAKASANKSGDKGLSHDEMVHATYLYTGTAPQGWSAVAVKGMKEVEGDKGEGVTVPEFEMPSGYKPVPVVWDGGPQSACCGLCGHDIKNIYYIQNDAEKWTMGVGSECVTKFGEGDSGERLVKKAAWAANRDFLSNVWETFDTLGHRFGDTDKHGQHHTHLGSSAPFWKIMAESGAKNHNEIAPAQRREFESAAAKINTVYGQLKKLLYNSAGAPVTHAGKEIVSRSYNNSKRGYHEYTIRHDASKDAAITAWTKRNAEEARKLIGEVDEILRSLPEKQETPQSFSRGYAPAPQPPAPYTQTPEFKAWHEGSHVAHPDGSPMVVHHGSPDVRGILKDGFRASPNRGGVHFASSDYATADSYADDRRAMDYQNAEPHTIPLHLAIKNPMVINAGGKHWRETEKHVQAAKDAGHDGMIIHNSIDHYQSMRGQKNKEQKPSTVYAWFHPHQAKSAISTPLLSRVDRKPIAGATANSGAFSPDDNRLTFSRDDDFGPVELFGDSEEFGPVEFARKPAKGQVAFDFDSPVESHLDDAPGENVATKQDQLYDVQESDVPPEHHEEAKALSEKHGGGEVRRLKNGDWQLRAPIGGKVSEVNGVFYIGGRFMPIHGIDSQAAKKLKPKREKSKGDLFTPPKPNENGRQREKRVEMTPDEIAAEKERREEQRQWNEIASGPLGRLLDLKAEPRYEGATPILDEWLRLAEKIGKEGIAKLKDRLEPEVHSSMEAAWKPIIERDAAITDEEWKKSHYGHRRSADDIEWEKNELHNRADRWASDKPRIYKAHEKLVPGSHYVRELLSELMNDTDKQDKGGFIPRLKKYSDMLAALVPAPLVDVAEARQHGYFGNKFDGRTAEGKKVKAGDGWVKKNADGKYETFTDEQVRDAIKPAEFSRSLDSIGPVEFSVDPPSQVHPTQTPGFKKWHEGSHVVNRDGSPMRVYHGTQTPFETADTSDRGYSDQVANQLGDNIGMFFTNSRHTANDFSQRGAKNGVRLDTHAINANQYPEGAAVLPTYLSVKNPRKFRDQNEWREFLRGHGRAGTNAREQLESLGHDGVVIHKPSYSGKESKEKWFVAFHPHQVKSSFNREFDPADSRINFSRDLADFAPVEFGLMDWFRKKQTPQTPQTPPSSAPAGDEPEQVHESKWSPEVPVESSNVHSYSWEKQGNEGQGNMIVRYKNKEGGSGPVYRYIGTPKSVYEGMEAAPSKGGFVWDRLRVRGSKVAHQYPFSLAGTGATDYIPRAASLRRGFKGEHYIERSFQGRKSELAPGTTTGRPAERLDGYDPGKLTFKPSPPSPSLPKPATPQPPAPSKTSSLIAKVASFFRKPKTPREFSRDEIEAFELMLADAAARD